MTTITKLPDPVAGGSRPPRRAKTLRAGRGRRLGDLRIALLFILPAMVGFVAFFLVPTVRGVYLSFTEYSVLGDPTWIGTKNYTAIFADELFWNAMAVTLQYVGLNILLAEDHPRNRDVVLALLEPFETNITVAENGVAALKALKSNTFDIVLMDIRMPVLDGVDALKQFREWEVSENRSKTPVIALTANAIEKDLETYKTIGFDACIAKPFTVHELISVISQLV